MGFVFCIIRKPSEVVYLNVNTIILFITTLI